MKTIAEVDANFAVKRPTRDGREYYNIQESPFETFGLIREGGKYRRMPEAVAKSVSEGVFCLHANTAGGRVRFRTDSTSVAIAAKLGPIYRAPHFAMTGGSGFDLYETGEHTDRYMATFVPPCNMTDGYESALSTDGKMREYTINFPLYNDVIELEIGLDIGARLEAPSAYVGELPVVYYGSSITQGGCASRPGRAYQNVISRRFHRDFVNLGFSGNAKGEDNMADYVASLPMSMFVYDYDHNAPTPEHLAATHEKMFRRVRAAHPDIPIILMTRPKLELSEEEKQRLEIVRTTWENARRAGDENVYFLTGAELMADCGDEGTVDHCHPTDLGFASMARALGDLMQTIYNQSGEEAK